MDKIYLDKNIYYIENVLSPEDLAIINKDCRDKESWATENVGHNLWKNNVKNCNRYSNNVLNKLKQIIVEEINTKEMTMNFSNTLSRFVPNEKLNMAMDYHYDDTQPHTLAGLVFYINDDYEGGEIHYREKDILWKPIKNSIVVHPASKEYTHGVKSIITGERYMVTMFGYEKNWFENDRGSFNKHLEGEGIKDYYTD
jgi:hypothetical protein